MNQKIKRRLLLFSLIVVLLLFSFTQNILASSSKTLHEYLEQNNYNLSTVFKLYLKHLDEDGLNKEEQRFLDLLVKLPQDKQEEYGKLIFNDKEVSLAILEKMEQEMVLQDEKISIEKARINQIIDKFAFSFVKGDIEQILSCCHDPILLHHYDWDNAFVHPLSSYRENLKNIFAKSDIVIDRFTNRNLVFVNESQVTVQTIEYVETKIDSKTSIEENKVILTLLKDQNNNWKISEYVSVEPSPGCSTNGIISDPNTQTADLDIYFEPNPVPSSENNRWRFNIFISENNGTGVTVKKIKWDEYNQDEELIHTSIRDDSEKVISLLGSDYLQAGSLLQGNMIYMLSPEFEFAEFIKIKVEGEDDNNNLVETTGIVDLLPH